MAKRAFPSSSQINDKVPQIFINKALGFIIRNNNTSQQNLFVGIEEAAFGKIILAPGESITISADRPDYMYSNLNIYFAFAEADPNNGGFMIVNQPQEEEVC